jgi:hypothetical protein
MVSQVPLDAKLAESLRQAAAEQGTNLEDVLNELVEKYLREVRRENLRIEFEHYASMHAELKASYLGQHVAIYEGRLVDHDPDASALVRRIRQRFGRAHVLITQVEDEPIPEYMIRSPRLVRSE